MKKLDGRECCHLVSFFLTAFFIHMAIQMEILYMGCARYFLHTQSFISNVTGLRLCATHGTVKYLTSETSTSTHIYLQSVVHVFTTSGIYGVVAVTFILRVQNYLRML